MLDLREILDTEEIRVLAECSYKSRNQCMLVAARFVAVAACTITPGKPTPKSVLASLAVDLMPIPYPAYFTTGAVVNLMRFTKVAMRS